jgi:tRNA(fMet)-specific endonuclease VapC
VIGANTLLLLDTNILVLMCRGAVAAQRLDDRFKLLDRSQAPLIAVVSVGEILAFSRSLKWGAGKQQTLRVLLDQLVVTDIGSTTVLNAYAELATHARANGRPMGQNDLWIAAVAKATDAVLLTTDKDFDWLHPGMIEREWVDPGSLT